MGSQPTTDKALLAKGIRRMAFSLVFLFLGPFALHQAFKNEGHPFYYPVLVLGVVFFLLAIYMVYRGLITIIRAVFDPKKRR